MIAAVKISEAKWNFDTGSIHCLAYTEYHEWELKIHCLNQPSGRYMLIITNSRTISDQILEYKLSIWIHSNKGTKLHIFINYTSYSQHFFFAFGFLMP